ncbi:2-amino-4-hydroxy-6-hydroxymethyldihydropteridine diphosphokinase [Corynebacterium imitans]|uniref:2-amino-4-hydroxy-6- hydroxymethyldihydropteridine diphosphokinase n=1 Tax=Corynebacterium imitans TaxID=156978 RepID=UPI0025504A60|nr:2-amino-4-hydroxy-6-hydroxymethyldihydropteridine diphosphokinase [Corynebacterium imitans]MDK8307197.1 2-amino-4-hydroxy-6-hydroxymethyldihydropteridine diphosphokinase [Corynebacterium imitans]MDK8638433.1 2-amino-4-hydroxy-6-hydroxymethyldihydropteridine diphosphokinase [Corynebacterium imitans]MDK8773615.1 2-amino-4-hydroxy-6-hydroxymethyldihydropteridine diphosphokinase [Corynebacterium imitans]
MRAVISAGSNMEDSRAHLASVRAHFADVLVAASSLYATAPWGKTNQPDFLNQSLLIDAPLSPSQLLHQCQALESAANRVRTERWGPRTLDVDIVDIDGYTSDDPVLTVPHPRAHLRAFVLAPWLELDPDATLGGERVADLLAGLDAKEREGVRRLED